MKTTSRQALLLAALLQCFAAPAPAQLVNPLSLIGKAVTTAADARTAEEVKNDIAIGADANKRLIDDKQAEWKGVSLLIFAQHVVLAGAVKSEDVKKRVAEVVKQDKRIRSLSNELIVIKKEGDDGSMVGDKVIEEKVNAALTTTKGIGSINMRWKSVNGHLIIMGVAQSKQEADLALKEARSVEGVKSVKSRLRVVETK
jgi:osmotically-inducible protein OsmY